MAFPIIAVAGIAISIGASILGNRSKKAGEKAKAEAFIATLGEHVDVPQMNPKRCWTEWQELWEEFQLHD